LKLHELHIQNFKFFPKHDTKSPLLEINGKNLLIYGENGSGKSTIYWAIYTLLESAFKVNEFDVEKYFKKGGEFGLVNIHATRTKPPYIKMVLKDDAGNNPKEYEVNPNLHQIVANMKDSAIRESGMASDFINYRVLFRLHHVKHSKDNDLFGWFEDEIFPYILIEKISKVKSVADVFKELKAGPPKVNAFDEPGKKVFPNPTMKDHDQEAVKKDYKLYQKYTNQLKRFNTRFNTWLKERVKRANEILKNDFEQNFEIKLDYIPAKVNVNEDELGWESPKIALKVPKYEGKRKVVRRAHSFLNEAKWTSIGLALRFAIIEDTDSRPDNPDLKLLTIDDMLLSLDMSNRDTVLNVLLDRYKNDFQLLILTHDRYFFELCKNKIQRKGQVNEWANIEMFEDLDSTTNRTKPKLIKDNGKVDKAWKLFHSKDFSSAANMVRQAAEKLCKHYLTNQEQLGGDYKPMKLDGLITKFITKGAAAGLTPATLQDLKDYKDRIMNPSSHYDIEQPLFKNELKKAIETLDKLKVEIGYQDL
jgi:ABC-type dipeptide/oligopeptide/nickel transport system ATPase subunit